jgi:cytochrome b6-f complex iron-sulfur subunit
MSCQASPRRRFLQVLAQGGALAGAASLGVGCAGGPSGPYDGGNVSALSVGTLRALSTGPVAVGRDANGVWAMTLICTHAGCDMASQGQVSDSGVSCGCHGSFFDAQGNPLGGPAHAPLDHFEVTIGAAGEITVNADNVVAESVRAAVTG